jgi:peptide/nickel transport system permease protein
MTGATDAPLPVVGTAEDAAIGAPARVSPGRMRWQRFTANRGAVIGLGFLAVLMFAAVFADWLSPYDPYTPSVALVRKPPTLDHLLGTDGSGRDILTRLLHGGRVSLSVGVVAVAIYVAIGTLIGALAGYRRGLVDGVLMRITDTVMSFPILIIVIAVLPVIGAGAINIMVVLGLLGWPAAARLVRGQFLSLREREFILAAQSIGLRDSQIITAHLLPNVAGPIVVLASFGVAEAIIAEAGLSLLGLGIQPPDPSWGQMLSEAMDVGILLNRPWMWMPPAVAIAVTVLAINFVGEGLRAALDPRATAGRR